MLGEKLAAMDLPADPGGDHVSVKEAVLPFDRFAGSDSLLGPEMRSTGEVMGVAADFPAAFAKAQAAAGARLPSGGTVFLTVTDSDKAGAVGIATQLHDLGFAIVATRGTASAISRMGIPVQPINKIADGSPHVVDWMERGDVDLVINTPTGTDARTDGYEIRSRRDRARHPLHHDALGRHGRGARDRRGAPRRPRGGVAPGPPRARPARRGEGVSDRTLAPLGRRLCPVVAHARHGAYDVISVLDAEGPAPAAGPVLHARRERALGRRRRRAAVPAARVLGPAAPRGRHARLPVRGRRPGHAAAVRAARGRRAVAARAARASASVPRSDDRRPLLVGGGVGIAPLAIWQDAIGAPALLGFRDARHAEGAALLRRRAGGDRRRLGRLPRARHRTAAGGDRQVVRGLRVRPAADARGGARAVRDRGRARPARARVGDGVRVRRLLRLRRAHARRLRAAVRRRARCSTRRTLELVA